jgi:Family of unknown function (DUF6527)
MKHNTINHEFVEYVPESLQPGVLYVSMQHATVVHSCSCGCGSEVVTPLSPAAWSLMYDGTSVSLYPSVGSWNLPCQSHYIIRRSRVVWATKWTQRQIEAAKSHDRALIEKYFGQAASTTTASTPLDEPEPSKAPPKKRRWWFRRQS